MRSVQYEKLTKAETRQKRKRIVLNSMWNKRRGRGRVQSKIYMLSTVNSSLSSSHLLPHYPSPPISSSSLPLFSPFPRSCFLPPSTASHFICPLPSPTLIPPPTALSYPSFLSPPFCPSLSPRLAKKKYPRFSYRREIGSGSFVNRWLGTRHIVSIHNPDSPTAADIFPCIHDTRDSEMARIPPSPAGFRHSGGRHLVLNMALQL